MTPCAILCYSGYRYSNDHSWDGQRHNWKPYIRGQPAKKARNSEARVRSDDLKNKRGNIKIAYMGIYIVCIVTLEVLV